MQEGVGTVEDTDIGARVGLRWARGPFEMANRLGGSAAADRAREVIAPWDLPLPELLASGGEIPIRLVSRDESADAARVTIQRPDAMNALNGAVVEQLDQAVGDRGAVVVAGSGKAFVAGADIKFFVDCLDRQDLDGIVAFTRHGQEVLARLADRPSVARVHGLSLGGGSELALACDRIVCSPKGSFGFPETGLGIYPGLGGIPRLARRIGAPLAKYFVYTGTPIDAATALALGVCDAVEDFDGLDAACSPALAAEARPERPVPDDWARIARFFEEHDVDAILSGRALPGEDARLQRAVKHMGFKSAHALRLCERLFDEGAELPIGEALALDLKYLPEVFGHADAREGLTALLQSRRPTFQQA